MFLVHNVLNVVHRDIKPGNILVDEDDNVHLSDFGISEMMKTSTMTEKKSGTKYYLPPEIFTGKQPLSPPRNEIFANSPELMAISPKTANSRSLCRSS